jgi:hypothetical protein
MLMLSLQARIETYSQCEAPLGAAGTYRYSWWSPLKLHLLWIYDHMSDGMERVRELLMSNHLQLYGRC